jgi:hypothetical protein
MDAPQPEATLEASIRSQLRLIFDGIRAADGGRARA